MRKDLTDITLIVDRSGSMITRREDAEGGINAFIKDQTEADGEAVLTLIQFDSDYECVHNGVKIEDVPPYLLRPRGCTALYDALGKAINQTGERLSKLSESERPGNVVVVVVTDGQENASKEFSQEKVRELTGHQQEKYNWHFTYLGADASTFASSRSLGISAASTIQYDADKNMKQVFATMSQGVCRGRVASASGANAEVCYTSEERENVS